MDCRRFMRLLSTSDKLQGGVSDAVHILGLFREPFQLTQRLLPSGGSPKMFTACMCALFLLVPCPL